MTHEHIKALDNLIAAVEGGAFLLGAIKGRLEDKAYDAFFGSLDAAKALHEALLPGWAWEIMTINYPEKTSYVVMLKGRKVRDLMASGNQNPARAWLIAILKAYRAQVDAS